jgi:heterotetrameric sarcosine oxidase gamma subunit
VLDARRSADALAPVGGASPATHRAPGVELVELPAAAKFRLQAPRHELERLRAAAGERLPFAPGQAGTHDVGGDDPWLLWRAPGDWLAYSLALDADELEAELELSFSGLRLYRTNVSSLLAFFEIRGERALETLMRSATLDLEGEALPPGAATQTAMAQLTVTLHRPSAAPLWRLGVDRSAARWFWEWLVDSAELAAAPGRRP